MKDTRKNIKVDAAVKAEIEALRKELGVKNEPMVLAYLVAMFHDQKEKRITLRDHQRYLETAEEKVNQASM